jgi:hypothetical protein
MSMGQQRTTTLLAAPLIALYGGDWLVSIAR